MICPCKILIIHRLTAHSNTEEWDKLAKWIVKNELFSDNVRWLIQIPRLYDIFKKSGGVKDFEEVVRSEQTFFSIDFE